MRLLFAGLFLLILPTFAFAQATGEVESIGFNNTYRPDCWTPMVVRLHPQTNEPGTYQLQVWQYDVDGDRPVYTRQITLNGADQARDQRFWMYFLPQPINKGLPDSGQLPGSANTGTLKDLQQDLQVFLCTAGGKQITQLPITSTLLNVDPYRDYSQMPRGTKLILAVSDPGSQPRFGDYQNAVGITEDVQVVNLQPKDLPEDPIGYEAVDGIVWLNSDPADLDKGGEHKLAAIQNYVRFGGHLVICQPTSDWQKVFGFGDLLPVEVKGVSDKDNLEPLRSMAQPHERDPVPPTVDSWNRPVGPFQFARATAKPNAVVDDWIDWKEDGSYSDKSPYLVRGAYGLGQVTWVAQDLGNPAVAGRATTGWPYVWDKVFGWKNDTYVIPAGASKDDERLKNVFDQYAPGPPADLGMPLVQGLNLSSKGMWLIFVAIAFFLIYWVVAGPGSFLYLASKKRAGFSWFFFGLAAIAATAVTVLVVKLVLRGPPEIRHLSFVRVAPKQPTLVYSRFGLYIPRDGDQSIDLGDMAHEGVSYISGFAEHPQQLGDASEFPAPANYVVPVRDLTTTDPPRITVPYRSSLKKFQSRWIGDMQQQPAGSVSTGSVFTGSVKLDPTNFSAFLSGTITNQTGIDFTDVYLAFRNPTGKDWLIYLPSWSKNATIDLKADLEKKTTFVGRETGNALPGDKKILSDAVVPSSWKRDPKQHGWLNYWYAHLRRNGFSDAIVDDPTFTYVYPMLSLFDELPPAVNYQVNGQWSNNRVELFRRGARMLDVSRCIDAGELAILAAAPGPIPAPMQVNGNPVGGDGTIFYQFIFPLDRGNVDLPTTRPTK
jgi:hypothetical protein